MGNNVDVIVDGRYGSPGNNATYCTLVDCETNQVLDFFYCTRSQCQQISVDGGVCIS